MKDKDDYGLMSRGQDCKVGVVDFLESDYVGDLDHRRSIIGYLFTFAGGPICCRSLLQYFLQYPLQKQSTW